MLPSTGIQSPLATYQKSAAWQWVQLSRLLSWLKCILLLAIACMCLEVYNVAIVCYVYSRDALSVGAT